MTDETAAVVLRDGETMLVDAKDLVVLAPYEWHAKWSQPAQTFYAYSWVRTGRTFVIAHRLILGASKGVEVDHANHDGLDNRRSNIRLCTHSLQMANRRLRHDSKSGYKGMCWEERTKRYEAYVGQDGKKRRLGRFKDPWEAAQAYNAAALEQWGEFALLNERREEAGDGT